MNRPIANLAFGAAALALIGSGTTFYVAVRGSGEEEAATQAGALASGANISTAAPCAVFVKDVPCNPDAGLTDAERDALYQRLRNEGDRLHREWLAGIDIGALDLSSLPRVEMPALYLPGEASLSDAAAGADVIVAGRVSHVRPTQGVAIDTVFTVELAIKGAAGSTVLVRQAARLQPTQDGSSIEIVEAANAPMLLPGDRAVLFLQRTEPTSDEYYIQGSSGWHQVVDGTIRSSVSNVFGGSVAGKTEAEFVGLVTAAVKEAAAVSP